MGRRAKPLDPRERRFVDLYCESANSNGTQAALVAGYGSNAQVAGVQSVRLLKRPAIRAAIDEKNAQLSALYGFGPDRIMREIAAMASVPVEQLELKGNDKLKALELLAKLNRMFPGDRVEISGPGGAPIEHSVTNRVDIASLEPEQREILKQTLMALKAKTINQEPA
jgi:hypothetical protein